MIRIARPVLGEEEINAVRQVLQSGQIAQGPKVKEFEEKFAQYIGTKYAVAVSNGTAALQLALIALGVRPGDEVITSPLSFFASASSILLIGAKPVFVDVEERTYNMDPTKIRDAITPKTKAIMVVHLHGHPADMDPILEIAREENLPVLEDAAQAHGAKYKGKMAGSLGDAAAFSFYATKNMTTGEGGMVTTNSEEIAEMVSLLRHHGQTSRYVHKYLGYNMRMTEFQAAIGLVQLKKLDSNNMRRREIAKRYSGELSDLKELILPIEELWAKHSWHLYAIRTEKDRRDSIISKLRELGVDARPTYPIPLHKQPIMERLNDGNRNFLARIFPSISYANVSLPIAEKLTNELFYIPIYHNLTEKEVSKVIDSVRKVFS